jgi:hypothetical protein
VLFCVRVERLTALGLFVCGIKAPVGVADEEDVELERLLLSKLAPIETVAMPVVVVIEPVKLFVRLVLFLFVLFEAYKRAGVEVVLCKTFDVEMFAVGVDEFDVEF